MKKNRRHRYSRQKCYIQVKWSKLSSEVNHCFVSPQNLFFTQLSLLRRTISSFTYICKSSHGETKPTQQTFTLVKDCLSVCQLYDKEMWKSTNVCFKCKLLFETKFMEYLFIYISRQHGQTILINNQKTKYT